MVEELRLHVVSTANSKGLRDAAKDIKGLRGETVKLGDSFDDTEHEAFDLNEALAASRKRSDELRASFVKLGDPNLLKEIRKERGFGIQLERVRRDLMPSAGPDFVEGLVQNIGALPSQLRGAGVLAGITLGMAAAPALGGIISSAVLGTVGAGGVIGGAILAARDERVKNAWSILGQSILERFQPAQDAFVQPMIDAAAQLSQDFDASGLVTTLEKSAALMGPLTRGLGGFVRELGPGLSHAIDGAVPNMNVLEDELGDLGFAVGDMFGSMSSASRESALAMKDFLDVTEDTIVGLGDLFAGLSKVYAITRNPIIGKVLDVVPLFGLIGAIGKLGEGSETARDRMLEAMDAPVVYGDAALEAAGNVDALTQASMTAHDWMSTYGVRLDDIGRSLTFINRGLEEWEDHLRDQFDVGMDAARAADDYEAALDGVRDSLKENGITIDANTEKGRNNRDAFRELIASAQRVRETQLALGVPVSEANARYAAQIAVIEKIAAGAKVTRAELMELAGDYLIHVQTTFTTRGKAPSGSLGRSVKFSEFQHGGQTPAFEPFWAGEGGVPELVFPTGKPQYVMNGPDSAAFAARMARGAGRGNATVRYVIDLRLNGRTIREIAIDDAVGRGIPQATVAAAYP